MVGVTFIVPTATGKKDHHPNNTFRGQEVSVHRGKVFKAVQPDNADHPEITGGMFYDHAINSVLMDEGGCRYTQLIPENYSYSKQS